MKKMAEKKGKRERERSRRVFFFSLARHAPLHIYAPLHRTYSPGKGAEGIGSEENSRPHCRPSLRLVVVVKVTRNRQVEDGLLFLVPFPLLASAGAHHVNDASMLPHFLSPPTSPYCSPSSAQQLLTDALLTPFSLSENRRAEDGGGACLISGRIRTYTLMNGVCMCVYVCSIVCVGFYLSIVRASCLPLPRTAVYIPL